MCTEEKLSVLPRRLVAISACQTVVQLHVEEQSFITRLSAKVVVNKVKWFSLCKILLAAVGS